MMLPRSPRPRKRAVLDDVVRAAGMHEHEHAELRRLGPERIVLRQRQILAVHVAADRRAAQPEPLDAVLELLAPRGRDTAAPPTPSRRTDRDASPTHFASPSFCACTIARARSRSAAYHQKPLMLSACMSTPCLVHHARGASGRGSGCRRRRRFLERRALDDVLASGMTQWAWTSMTLTRRPPIVTCAGRPPAPAPAARLRSSTRCPARMRPPWPRRRS